MDFNKDDQRDMLAQALAEADNSSQVKEGCTAFFLGVASHLFNAMLLMFAVAIIGHPLGYLVCLLLTYTASNIIGASTLGEYLTLNKIYKQLGGK